MKMLKVTVVMALLAAVSHSPLLAQTIETYTFTTNRLVPDGDASGLADVQNISSAIGTITDLKVHLKVTGEFNGDLYAYLRHSSGYTVLLNRPGKTASNLSGYSDSGLDVIFETGATNGDIHVYQDVITPVAGSPLTGSWEPDGRDDDPTNVLDTSPRTLSLTNFNGLSANGQWTLYLADLESGGTNLLTEWELEIAGSASPTLTWTNPADITYGTSLNGSQLNATATYDSTNVAGTFVYTPDSGTVLNAGSNQTLSVTFTPADSAAFLPVTTSVTLNVQQASLVVTAQDTNKVYGAALPDLTAAYSGFVNGDTVSNLMIAPTLATGALASSPAGPYTITASGGMDTNYSISYVDGTLTVDPAPLVITADDTNKIYGGALPTFTATYSGLVNGDTVNDLTSAATLATTALASSPVGAYPITASGAADANYSISYVDGTLTVDAAPLVITADNTNKVYGAALPTFTATYAGFVNGDTVGNLTTVATLGTVATASSPVGAYAITASDAADTNYSISYVAGTLTVGTAPLVITADDTNKVYGAALPAFTATYSGFVNGDTVSNLTTAASLSTTATAASPIGSYAITASGATDTNYSISYVDGTLTVGTAPLVITADDTNKVYGAALPTFTATYSGFVNGDTVSSLTTPATLATTATASSAVGAYPITASGAADTNYSISYVDGTLTVTQSLSSGVLATSANPASAGTNVTFTVTLNAVAPGVGAPDGTVDFRIDGSIASSGALSGGVATFSTSLLSHGSHTVVAEYAGSQNFAGTTNSLSPNQEINSAPLAGADSIFRYASEGVKVSIDTLLANDSDADGDPLSLSAGATSTNGATIAVLGGWVFYTPPPGFTNADLFTYTLADGYGGSATGLVTVAIQVDTAPTANLLVTDLGGGSFLVQGNGIPARAYHLEYSDTSGPYVWQVLPGANVTADGSGAFQFTDTTGSSGRYYRSVYP